VLLLRPYLKSLESTLDYEAMTAGLHHQGMTWEFQLGAYTLDTGGGPASYEILDGYIIYRQFEQVIDRRMFAIFSSGEGIHEEKR